MSLKIRMLLLNQFENLLGALNIARDELNSAILLSEDILEEPEFTNNQILKEKLNALEDIDTDISIAKQRIKDFETKTIKEFEKRHSDKLRRLKLIKKENRKKCKT